MSRSVGVWRGAAGEGWGWALTRTDEGFVLQDRHGELGIPAREASRIVVRRRWWRTSVTITGPKQHARKDLRGLTREQGKELSRAVQWSLLEAVTSWHEAVHDTIACAKQKLAWIPAEMVAELIAGRPDTAGLDSVPSQSDVEHEALRFTAEEAESRIHRANQEIATALVQTHRAFFDTIETSALTEEQARAVVTYDNRVNVIAAAGSGKTSVMVARAAYAVMRGLALPEEILLLAFNTDAAAELQRRIQARFAAAGIAAEGVRATTFHAFGLHVIGRATGRKPTVAPWVTNGQDTAVLNEIVTELRHSDPAFALDWDMFRLLYARTGEDLSEEPEPDAWDPSRRIAGLRTYRGDVVRSQGERLIADWLFLHGVLYEYERPYLHDTADPDHGQYRPDFYYPAIDTWHEHWGLDAEGKPPPGWSGYEDGIAWKREMHRQHGTTLLETTWAGVMTGTDLLSLNDELGRRGVQLEWDPHRGTAGGARPMTDAALLRLIRTFMTHVKSNSLTPEEVAGRLGGRKGRNTERAKRFLALYWPIHQAWQDRLAAAGCVDFEDMLVQAAEHLETGRYTSPYRLVMVDEFQDISWARARLARGLVRSPGRHLLAVGDDWQSINRFAGADLSVVTGFHEYFGPGPDLYLTKTFRSLQAIAQTAARFVTKNPAQVTKHVVSVHTRPTRRTAHEGVQLRHAPDSADIPGVIAGFLTELDQSVRTGAIDGAAGRAVTVDVLGRYRHEHKLVPTRAPATIRLRFRTIHSAKGLEADYVVVPNLATGTYGFPSQIADDPVLALAMSHPDAYPHAEERRLFYVALTRARHGVVLIHPDNNPSPFVTELVRDGLLSALADQAQATPCPQCRSGILRRRTGRFGPFWGCSSFPRCRYTTNER